MKFKNALAAIALSSFAIAQPLAASAAPVSIERTSSVSSEEEAIGGASTLWIVFAALGLTALMIVLLTDGSKDPVSP
ncbi:hypothetical protein [Altererythrobacter sp. Root672]|uniref:hypothetical protein n=1 Tax=Altererythrobacter sp. Root672 TaxID=1736584 RepID=UPI0006F5689F|nr:hypothetical protein [Altererythrobacter sp. Root672]KRA80380.1 hypothetical protein ASD76_14475 [Altererythrobacter sp. Root672]